MYQLTTRKPGEIAFAIVMLLGSVFLFWQAYYISGFSSLSSAGALPLAAAAVMVISSTIALIKTMGLTIDTEIRFFHHVLPPIVSIVIALILLFSVMLEPVGFILSALLFLFLGITFLQRSSFLVTATITVICLISVYFIFRIIFQVVLPEGVIPEREWMAIISRYFS